jgi:hypothetical protein
VVVQNHYKKINNLRDSKGLGEEGEKREKESIPIRLLNSMTTSKL